MQNHQRTSSRNGITNAHAVARAASMLADRGAETPAELLKAAESSDDLRSSWQTIPGQRSTLTGPRCRLMLANAQEVKPDRMIRPFVAAALGRPDIREDDARRLLIATAQELAVQPRDLDYQARPFQSGRIELDEVSDAENDES